MIMVLMLGGLQIAAGQYSCSTSEITPQTVSLLGGIGSCLRDFDGCCVYQCFSILQKVARNVAEMFRTQSGPRGRVKVLPFVSMFPCYDCCGCYLFTWGCSDVPR